VQIAKEHAEQGERHMHNQPELGHSSIAKEHKGFPKTDQYLFKRRKGITMKRRATKGGACKITLQAKALPRLCC